MNTLNDTIRKGTLKFALCATILSALAGGIAYYIDHSTTNLSGTYHSEDNTLYPSLEFKGKSTVTLTALIVPYTTTYTIDDNYVRVETDKGSFLFKIINNKTLQGEGWCKGTYKKQ